MMVEPVMVDASHAEDVRSFVLSASSEEVVERVLRLEHRLVELDARLRAVGDIVEDASL